MVLFFVHNHSMPHLLLVLHYYKTLIILECRLLYTCCRDGAARDNKVPRKTSKKRKSSRESRKLDNSYCLARMYVKQHHPTGKVEVTYISTHTNHSLGVKECKYLPLPLTVRKEIQEKFAQGVTLERIMDGKNVCV